MIYWKDTVETRRAVAAALPLLRQASYVSMVRTVSDGDLAAARNKMELVTQWFERHGVTVDAMVYDSEGDAGNRLRAIAREQEADFVVAGAYSHSRLRERVFGGVTKDIFRHIERFVFLSN